MELIAKSKEKAVLVLTTALIALAGFEVLQSIMRAYELAAYLWASLAVYAALVFMQSFVFDLHIKRAATYQGVANNFLHALKRRFDYMLKWSHWVHYQNYLILPGIVYWSTIVLIFLNPFHDSLKQTWIIISTIALASAFWYLKTIFYEHGSAHPNTRQQIFLVKLYASYVSFAGALGVTRFFGYEAEIFGVTVFCLTFLLVYQALFQHHNVSFETQKFILFISAVLGLVAFAVYIFWNSNYFTGALVITAVYNTAWGLTHHKFMDRDLSRKIVYEYAAVLFLVLVVVFSITNFAERI